MSRAEFDEVPDQNDGGSVLLAAGDHDITPDHRMFGLVDQDWRYDLPVPPGRGVSTGNTAVFLGTEEDIIRAELRVEFWDGPAPFDARQWPRVADATVSLPSGQLMVDQATAGGFTIAVPGGSGTYRVRLAWRELPPETVVDGEPEAFGLAQLWPVDAAPRLLTRVERDISPIANRLFGFGDIDLSHGSPQGTMGRAPRRPVSGAPWLSVGDSTVYFESDHDLDEVALRLEFWDLPAPYDESHWPKSQIVTVPEPIRHLGIDQTYADDPLQARGPLTFILLPARERYRVRLAWREGSPASALAQFWPDRRC